MQSPSEPTPLFASGDARRLSWLLGAALLLVAFALCRGVLGFGFLYLRDDDVNVVLNPHMGGLGWARLHWMFTDWSYVRRYMPLGWLGFSAVYEVAGLHPGPYHAAGLALYAANTALVYLLVLRVLRLFGPGAAPLGAWPVCAAALAAAWWALHPLRVETTAWVSGNLYGQSMGLLMASALAYLLTYGRQGPGRTAWLLASLVAYAASLLTYPVALPLPLLFVALDWLYARGHPGAPVRRMRAEKAAFLGLLAAALAVTLVARSSSREVFGGVPGLSEMPLSSRLAQSAYIAAYYLWRPWWPAHLSPLYDTLVGFHPADPAFILSAVLVAALTAAALALLRSRPGLAALWFGYLVMAAPFFGLTEKPHFPSDRYGYFLSAMEAAALAAALSALASRGARAAALVASLAGLALLGALTHRQLRIWSDDRTQHAYVLTGLSKQPLLDDFTSRQLILEFLRGNEGPSEEAVREHLRSNPASPGYQKAAAIIADKRRVEPYYGSAPFLAILQDKLALDFARQGQLREANDHFEDALAMDERFYQAAFDRALVLVDLGRPEDALRSFLYAEAYAPRLPGPQRAEFLRRIEALAQAQGKQGLARAARAARGR